jgi:L-amino acid N-acyltransferase YncA
LGKNIICIFQIGLAERSKLPTVVKYMKESKEYSNGNRKMAKMPLTIHLPTHLSKLEPVIADYAKECDMEEILDIYKREIAEGHGISTCDDPTEELREMIRNPHPHHVFVYRSHGTIIGCSTCSPSEYGRSFTPHISDGFFMLKPEFTLMGLATAILKAMYAHVINLGYVASVSDVFACNPASYMVTLKTNGRILGRIPYAGRSGKDGWTDVLIVWTPSKGTESKL